MNHYWIEMFAAAQPWLARAVAHMQTPYAWFELFSAACALLGSLLLALKGRRAGWGWILFACSNAGWIVFAQGFGHWFFLVQQIGFSAISAIGIWTYLIRPQRTVVLLWRTAPADAYPGLWRITQMPRVAEIWREQGRLVQALTSEGDWE